jgi:hypothetical protein
VDAPPALGLDADDAGAAAHVDPHGPTPVREAR